MYSYISPDQWIRKKLPGLDYTLLVSTSDSGLAPSIYPERPPQSGTVDEVADALLDANRDEMRAYVVIDRTRFSTDSGLPGLKVTAQYSTTENLAVSHFLYLLQDGPRVLVLGCRCAYAVTDKYQPVFDAAMKSLKNE